MPFASTRSGTSNPTSAGPEPFGFKAVRMRRLTFFFWALVALAWADRVLPGAHFQKQIPMYPTMQVQSKKLGERLSQAGQVYAVRNTWYYHSHQSPVKVAQFYAEHLPGVDRQASAANHVVFTIHPDGARLLNFRDGTRSFEFVEIEIADVSDLNQVLTERERSARTVVHISEYLAP